MLRAIGLAFNTHLGARFACWEKSHRSVLLLHFVRGLMAGEKHFRLTLASIRLSISSRWNDSSARHVDH
jgi:hypothetical protein